MKSGLWLTDLTTKSESQSKVAKSVPETGLIKTDDLEVGYNDWWHFRGPSEIELGRRFASYLLDGQKRSKVLSLGDCKTQIHDGKHLNANYVDAVFADGSTRTLEVDVENKSATYDGENFDCTVETENNDLPLIDGKLDDREYESDSQKTVSMFNDLKGNPTDPTIACSSSFSVFKGKEGLLFQASIEDKQINSGLTFKDDAYDSFDGNSGFEIYLHNSNSKNDTSEENRSISLFLSSSNLLRVYKGKSKVNSYQKQEENIKDIKRGVSLNGTCNRDWTMKDYSSALSKSVSFEVYIPYTVCSSSDIADYSFALGFKAYHYLGSKNKTEMPYGIYCKGEMKDFSNTDYSSYQPLSSCC